MKIDKRPAAIDNPPQSINNTQLQQKSVSNRNRQTNNVVDPEVQPPAVDVDDTDSPIKENVESEETVDSLRAKLDGKRSKISDLETGSRLLEARCVALESEVVDLKTTLNLANIRLVSTPVTHSKPKMVILVGYLIEELRIKRLIIY